MSRVTRRETLKAIAAAGAAGAAAVACTPQDEERKAQAR